MDQVFQLPMPPSTNNLFVTLATGRRAKSKLYRGWLKTAGWELLRQRVKPCGKDRVVVTIAATRPSRRRDLDNLAKPILDLLVRHAILKDDSQVEALAMAWRDRTDPIVDVTISPGKMPS